jgi:hypothetical protein
MSYWDQYQRARCLPSNCNCELVRDGWIGQPSAFYSSIFVLIFALLLYKKIPQKTDGLKLFVFSLLLLGVSSHFAHASFTEFALAMDFGGIILVTSYFAVMKIFQRITLNFWGLLVIIILYFSGASWIFYSLEKWFKVGLCLVVFLVAMGELVYSEGKAFLKAHELHKALGILVVAFGFFLVDELKLFCSPESLLQGHSVWHFGTSLSLYLYGKWRYRSI